MNAEVTSTTCPFCGTLMGTETVLCSQCGRFNNAHGEAKAVVRKTPLIERANIVIANWESLHADRLKRLKARLQIARPMPRLPRMLIGGALLALSIPILPEWMRQGGFASARDILSLWMVGLVLLTWPFLYHEKREEKTVTITESSSDSSLRFLGYENNLAVIQTVAVAIAIVSGLRGEIDQAWYACIVGAVLTPILRSSKVRAISVALGVIAALYFLYLFAVSDIGYRIQADQYARSIPQFVIPIAPIVWIMIVIAAIPQLQIPRLNRFGIGRLRGDVTVGVFGTRVTVAFASAVLICCAWRVTWLLWYAPGWLPASLQGL